MTYSFGKASLNKMKGVKPEIVELSKSVISVSPVDFGIVQGVRTLAEQRAYYAQGRKPYAEVLSLRLAAGLGSIGEADAAKIVTHTMQSNHLIQKDGWGYAIDFAVWKGGGFTWDKKDEYLYHNVVAVYRQEAQRLGIPVAFGADWIGRKVDLPHVEYDPKGKINVA